MKRSIVLAAAALLLAGCRSGADVADDQEPATPDSASIEVIGDHPPARDSQTPAVPVP